MADVYSWYKMFNIRFGIGTKTVNQTYLFQFVEQAVGQSDRDLSVIRELVGRIGLAALLKSLAYERHDDYAHEVMVTTAYIVYLLSEIILFDILAHIAHLYTEKDYRYLTEEELAGDDE